MKRLILPRRRALVLSGGMLAAPMLASGVARAADDWPNKPVRYINVFPPGGPTDTLSRIVCNQLAELTGQQFIVDNKSGLGRQCRHRRHRQGRPRRLHDRPLHHRLAVDRAHALRQAAVRRRQGLHRRRHDVVGAQHADGAPRSSGEVGARADRAVQGQSRQVFLRLVGVGHEPASQRRDLQAARRPQPAARALSRQRARLPGSSGGPGRHDVRQHSRARSD